MPVIIYLILSYIFHSDFNCSALFVSYEIDILSIGQVDIIVLLK